MTNKRLLKEYINLKKNPIENILTKPNEDNILLWNYIIIGKNDPYTE